MRKAEGTHLRKEGELTVDERAKLKRLDEENRVLKMERDFQKKRRPASRERRSEVPLHRRGEGQFPDRLHVQAVRRFAERLLRISRPSTVRVSGRRSEAHPGGEGRGDSSAGSPMASRDGARFGWDFGMSCWWRGAWGILANDESELDRLWKCMISVAF